MEFNMNKYYKIFKKISNFKNNYFKFLEMKNVLQVMIIVMEPIKFLNKNQKFVIIQQHSFT